MAFHFNKDRVRPLWLTYREPVGTGDGATTRFKLPEGTTEQQRIVIYQDGGSLPSDAKLPVMEGVGEPVLTKDGKPVLDKEGNAVLSKGKPMLQEKDGLKIPIFRPVGWRLVEGYVEFDVPPPVGCELTTSRIVSSVEGIEAECFKFGKIDGNLMLEMQADRPDPENEMYATEEELAEKRKAEQETYRKLDQAGRKKATEKKLKAEEEASKLAFEWISKVFFRVVIGWSVRATDDAGDVVEVPFTEENVKAYLNGDGGKTDRMKATNLAYWLMARSSDIVRAQAARTGELAKN